MTPKQKLQKDRSWFKFKLGQFTRPDLNSLTSDEIANWNIIIEARNRILECFDNNSKDLGLSVPEHKCYVHKCRNKVKYFMNYPTKKLYFCEKHSKQFNDLDYELERLCRLDRQAI